MADTHLGLECDECRFQVVPGLWKVGDDCPNCRARRIRSRLVTGNHGHMRVQPSDPWTGERRTEAVLNTHARDGETLSDERRIDELLREFQMACEDAAEFNADSIRASAKHRAILRNELRSELLAVAALRAELADARADTERVELIEELIVEADGRPFDLPNAESNALVRIETWGSVSFRSVVDAERAARAASGEDANGQK